MTLKQLRIGQFLSQEQAAEAIGVSRVSISLWETGRKRPRLSNLQRMCEAYKCTPNDIFLAIELAKSKDQDEQGGK